MNRKSEIRSWRGQNLVAQIFNLPYRRIGFCGSWPVPSALELSGGCRLQILQIGDTAQRGWRCNQTGARTFLSAASWDGMEPPNSP